MHAQIAHLPRLAAVLLGCGCAGTPIAPPPPVLADRNAVPAMASAESDRSVLLSAPLAEPRADFFHAALLVPPLQTARTISEGSVYARLGSNHSHSEATRTLDGFPNTFNGGFHEWAAPEVHWGALPGLELMARTAYGGWDEHEDHFVIVDNTGRRIVRFEDLLLIGHATQRHDNITRVDLGAKLELAEDSARTSTTSLALGVKVPVTRPHDLSNAGTYDVAATLLESLDLGAVTLHANAGGVLPIGNQNLFIREAGIDIEPFVQAGLGATWTLTKDLALAAQIEASSSAFRDVTFLRESPITVGAGARKLSGKWVFEVGGQAGLDPHAANEWALFVAAGYLF